ncbi:polysaccharide deacetylase [Sinorhizobium fredii USDA 205]|uniref:Polysaccharide deacetylase n=1 Tax=Rhizobium fredii TaxID=380 RepID=A0A844AMN5_RHIFR|nr:polysaccharide deacetylase family protein [Sinorhizobium fredii]KSV92348.1 polysaccharide deacetylase [Sinorhizobium fredii USDA 205]MQX12872.1 polysaccharide deacetylase [Sinorhizobium fredii]GEC33381.1 polysaccharide deacetylase [Sinorhizobium fredii]GLS11103.1 polysaccharide deacetylase [Sinorhizobium fredii]
MNTGAIWQALIDRLDQMQEAGQSADFWLRDDDAVEPTAALHRLLELTDRYSVPLTLAVIPAHTDERLERCLAGRRDIGVAVHGWSHANHAPQGEKRQELGGHRPGGTVSEELRSGYARLKALFPGSFVPLLVPPWNRIDTEVVTELGAIGFRALSVFGPEASGKAAALLRPGLQIINTHVDVIDWRGSRACRDHAQIVRDILARLEQVAKGGGSVGILTHHLVHDENVWAFLSKLFEITATHPASRWRKVSDFISR